MTELSEFEIELLKNELTGYITRMNDWCLAMTDIYVHNQHVLTTDNMLQAVARFDAIERAVFENSNQSDQ